MSVKSKTVDGKCCSRCVVPKSLNNLTCGSGYETKCVQDKSLYSLKTRNPTFPDIDSFFIIKKTNTGNYEVILNKEFENVIKSHLKEVKLDLKSSEEYIFKIKESTSGQRIIEIEPKCGREKGEKDAVIIRTSSGSLRLFSTDSHSNYKRTHPNDNNNIVTKEDFMNLLMKFQTVVHQSTKIDQHTSTCCSNKSKSDSNVYQTTKVNLDNEPCYMEVHDTLRRTKSGNYIMTLSKISCTKDVTNQAVKRNYVNLPITYNKGVTLKYRIKVSACKCAHIFVNKNEIDDIISKCPNFTLKYDSKENIHICKGVQSAKVSIHSHKYGSRYSNLTICEKMKKASSYKECCQDCGLVNVEVNKYGAKVNDESCAIILKKILEKPPKCNTKQCLRHNCSNTEDKGACNCNIYSLNAKDHERQRRIFRLRSLENLPPQLPPFLKQFTLKMA